MNKNNSFRQFIMDGLIGVVAALLIYGVLMYLLFLFLSGSTPSLLDVVDFVIYYPGFPTPQIFIILTAFISVGISGQFLEIIPSRRYWFVRILPGIGISCLVGIVSSMISVFIIGGYHIDITTEGLLLLLSLIGAILGYLIGGLTGLIFFPQKRLNKIIVGAIANAFANTTILASIIYMLLILLQP